MHINPGTGDWLSGIAIDDRELDLQMGVSHPGDQLDAVPAQDKQRDQPQDQQPFPPAARHETSVKAQPAMTRIKALLGEQPSDKVGSYPPRQGRTVKIIS
jgi:hypothetical protein